MGCSHERCPESPRQEWQPCVKSGIQPRSPAALLTQTLAVPGARLRSPTLLPLGQLRPQQSAQSDLRVVGKRAGSEQTSPNDRSLGFRQQAGTLPSSRPRYHGLRAPEGVLSCQHLPVTQRLSPRLGGSAWQSRSPGPQADGPGTEGVLTKRRVLERKGPCFPLLAPHLPPRNTRRGRRPQG